MGWFRKVSPEAKADGHGVAQRKSIWTSLLPVMACGAGLFSDGYVNNVSVLYCPSPVCLPNHWTDGLILDPGSARSSDRLLPSWPYAMAMYGGRQMPSTI
jgi:hypothetical protein